MLLWSWRARVSNLLHPGSAEALPALVAIEAGSPDVPSPSDVQQMERFMLAVVF